ncbi:hypothetical protein QZH41_017260, partial [Actinostola sp. cb2023]
PSTTNITNNSQSDNMMTLESNITWTAIYVFVGIFIIFFNALVLLSFFKNKSLRTRTNYFIASLAWADFLVGAISIPGWLAIILTGYDGNSLLGQVWTAFDMLAGIGSIFHLMALSWDRLCAIVWPLRHRLYTRRKYIGILCLVWGFSIVVSGLSVIGNQRNKKAYNVSVIVLCFFLPLVGIVVAQGTIFYQIHQTRYRREQRSIRHIKREIRAAKTISIMIVLFVIGWLPFFTIALINYITTVAYSAHAVLAVKFLQYSNSLFNPILYAQKFPEFRRAYAAMLCSCFKDKNEQYKKNLNPSCTYYRTGIFRSVDGRSPQASHRFTTDHFHESASMVLSQSSPKEKGKDDAASTHLQVSESSISTTDFDTDEEDFGENEDLSPLQIDWYKHS